MHAKKGTIFTIITFLIVIGFIVGGNYYWENRISENVIQANSDMSDAVEMHHGKVISAGILFNKQLSTSFNENDKTEEQDEEEEILGELTEEPITKQTTTSKVNNIQVSPQNKNQSPSGTSKNDNTIILDDKNKNNDDASITKKPVDPPSEISKPEEPNPPATGVEMPEKKPVVENPPKELEPELENPEEPKKPDPQEPEESKTPEETKEGGNQD